MRIIAGIYRSRKLVAPTGRSTRPTSDRLRERLFNVLQTRISDAVFADLYAGSGAVGLEAISRGARTVLFAEIARGGLEALQKNLLSLGLQYDGARIEVDDRGSMSLLRHIATNGPKLDIVFLDPPYEEGKEYRETLEFIGAEDVLAPGGVVVAEHSSKQPLSESYRALERYRSILQGEAALSFFKKHRAAQPFRL